MTCLADTILAGQITLVANSLIQYFRTVGVKLDASRVICVTSYEPDIGNSVVARVYVGGMAVSTLNILPFAIVGCFPGMTVCTYIDVIGLAAAQVGAQQEALRR